MKNFDQDVLAYANSQGIPELLEALVGYYKRLGLNFEKKDLLVTTGGSEAISMLMTALLDDDDEVIMAEPFYTNYKTFIRAAGGKLVGIPTTAEEGYQYAVKEKIEAVITPKTKAICIINPGNPTGKVLTHDEMKLIVDIALAHDLFIIADEVYREFVYDGKTMDTFGAFPEAAQHVVIVDSISKRFSGLRRENGLHRFQERSIDGQPDEALPGKTLRATLDQIGAAALYNMDPSYFNEIKAEYEHRRDVAVEALNEIEGIRYGVPEGAFYITCKLPVDDAEKFLMFLLTEFDVNGETCMFAPAGGFFTNPEAGKSDMRIAYVLKAEDMKAGINIIKEGIKAYNAR